MAGLLNDSRAAWSRLVPSRRSQKAFPGAPVFPLNWHFSYRQRGVSPSPAAWCVRIFQMGPGPPCGRDNRRAGNPVTAATMGARRGGRSTCAHVHFSAGRDDCTPEPLEGGSVASLYSFGPTLTISPPRPAERLRQLLRALRDRRGSARRLLAPGGRGLDPRPARGHGADGRAPKHDQSCASRLPEH